MYVKIFILVQREKLCIFISSNNKKSSILCLKKKIKKQLCLFVGKNIDIVS